MSVRGAVGDRRGVWPTDALHGRVEAAQSMISWKHTRPSSQHAQWSSLRFRLGRRMSTRPPISCVRITESCEDRVQQTDRSFAAEILPLSFDKREVHGESVPDSRCRGKSRRQVMLRARRSAGRQYHSAPKRRIFRQLVVTPETGHFFSTVLDFDEAVRGEVTVKRSRHACTQTRDV